MTGPPSVIVVPTSHYAQVGTSNRMMHREHVRLLLHSYISIRMGSKSVDLYGQEGRQTCLLLPAARVNAISLDMVTKMVH